MSSDSAFIPSAFPAMTTTEADKVRAEARASGYAEGYATGIRAAEAAARAARTELARQAADAEAARAAEHDRAQAALQAAVQHVQRLSAPVLHEAGDTLASAAIELAEAILGQVLDDAHFAARSALERATAEVAPGALCQVRLNPRDLQLLRRGTGPAAGIDLVADPTLASGDAIAELPDGLLDARIAAGLQRAKDALAGGAQ
ncbi:FliH/SctL family protein [Glutamicibacter nicotianae]|uniref:FliH/SctL family protein n=1 Tax=Glutamicibacter nicotianae TaxID=37929 RepID=UPI000EF87AE8|nr:FliH/SctL family protein [Glutamicibacter nicotianae]